ncbi:MAG: hypothetical protein AAB116_18770 [Candidatus Poribacteria bacterium]
MNKPWYTKWWAITFFTIVGASILNEMLLTTPQKPITKQNQEVSPIQTQPTVIPEPKPTSSPEINESVGEASPPSEPLEYQLAVINKGGYVSEDDITITRFRYLLESLDNKTIQNKQQIADMLVMGQKILREKYGKEYSLLALTEGVNKYITDSSNTDFAMKNTEYIQYLK